MMKNSGLALLIMISFLLIAGRSSGRLLMQKSSFISPDNPSVFTPVLNSLVDDESTLHSADGHVAVECNQEIGLNENKASSFRLSPIVQKTEKIEWSASTKAEGVFNLLPNGPVTPSGPSPKVNPMITEQRLSTSSNSPGVGHMQMIRPKSHRINVGIPKSHQRHGDDHLQQKKNKKRKLGSTPSPGGGH